MTKVHLETLQSTAAPTSTIGVYRITCTATGKCYIGWSENVKSRLSWHRSHLRRGKHPRHGMQEDFGRYGEESFTFVITSVHAGPDDARIEEATLIGDAFKRGIAYNSIVPVDVSEAFKTREKNVARREEAERQHREVEALRQREQKSLLYKRRLVSSWISGCVIYTRGPLDDGRYLEMINEFLRLAPFTEKEFGNKVFGDEDFVESLHDPNRESVTLAEAKQTRDFIESYLAQFERDRADYLPLLGRAEKLINTSSQTWICWLGQERAAA